MDTRLLPMGRTALLVEVAGTDAALSLRRALAPLVESRAGLWAAVDHLVVGARTVLVVLRPGGAVDEVGRACLEIAATVDDEPPAAADRVVEVGVRYDGPDLEEVARLTGLSADEVVQAHTDTPWRVGFGGFAPGFAYLVDGDPRLQVPRRAEPRTRVPAGSVALAGEFSGVYPQESPGGWQLIGSTDVVLWDAERDPPALLTPGTEVRFVATDPSSSGRPAAPLPVSEVAPVTVRPLEEGTRGLEVLATGPLALVEDLGRPGFADVGVGRSGAADPAAYLLGLRLVGHLLDVGDVAGLGQAPASVEVTLGGLSVRARGDLLVALTGAPCPADVDGRPAPHAAPMRLADGQVLTLGTAPAGLRTWLAVRGGVSVPPVLGSRSTDTLSRVGPAPLAVGDVLPVGAAPVDFPVVDVAPSAAVSSGGVVLDVEPGPRAEWCNLDGLESSRWTVSSRSNRIGIRLEGNTIRRQPAYDGRELPSEGMVVGAVQVPPSGEPVVFLADHPVTGGYPVVAVLTPDALALAAQLRPGSPVRLRMVGSRPTRG